MSAPTRRSQKSGISKKNVARACAAAIALTLGAAHAAKVAPSPALPMYGQAVAIELRDTQPYFVPSARYVRNGNNITVDFEAPAKAFGPYPPNLGSAPVPLGELPPGNYNVTARVIDIDDPTRLVDIATSQLAVVPPSEFGVYPVPSTPHAHDPLMLTIRSAAYMDLSSMRASVNGNTIRVDFDYLASLSATPGANMATWGSVKVGNPGPGTYHLEGWGRPTTGGVAEKYFTRDIVVATPSTVVEYYNDALDHYFITAFADEVSLLDGGGQGGWKRTGQAFHAWINQQEAPPQAVPVCRFYAKGANSHFYTGDASECAGLRNLEQAQKAEAQGAGKAFLGWGYEGVAFYALMPQNGQCPAGTTPVARLYNGRSGEGDPNHRFMPDAQLAVSMVGWMSEGVAFCSPA
jgi:hypothetical protein